MLQFEFQSLFVVAEKPQLGLYSILAAGCLNMILDGLLVGVVGYDEELMDLTVRAFIIFSFSFPFVSVPIYGSSFFTALNDGFTSAATVTTEREQVETGKFPHNRAI